MFVSGSAYTITTGKGPQRRNAEVMLVETVRRRRDQVVDLLPERAADLRRIVEAGLDLPEPPPRKDRCVVSAGQPFEVRQNFALNLSKMIGPPAILPARSGRSCFWVLAKLKN